MARKRKYALNDFLDKSISFHNEQTFALDLFSPLTPTSVLHIRTKILLLDLSLSHQQLFSSTSLGFRAGKIKYALGILSYTFDLFVNNSPEQYQNSARVIIKETEVHADSNKVL